LRDFAHKYVVKPVRQGSSVGVSIVSTPHEAVVAARKTFSEYGDCMIEEFVPGTEVTVGILHGRPLPIIEVRTQGGFYDYHAKYADEKTEYLFDTIGGRMLQCAGLPALCKDRFPPERRENRLRSGSQYDPGLYKSFTFAKGGSKGRTIDERFVFRNRRGGIFGLSEA